MKAVVAAFIQEKALVGAFSVIVALDGTQLTLEFSTAAALICVLCTTLS